MAAKIIVIFSTKGGVGKTLIATNLAVSIAKTKAYRVALLDYDLTGAGGMAMALKLEPQKALVDLLSLKNDIDKETSLKKYVTVYSAAGAAVDFLPAIHRPRQSPHIKPEHITWLLNKMAGLYDYIIVDGGTAFTDCLVAAFDMANMVLLIVTPDILSVYQTKWGLDVIQSLHFPLNMVKLVVNRAESKTGVTESEVKAVLPFDIIGQIPSEGKIVVPAINRGIPVVIDSPNSKVSLSINKLAATLVSQEGLYVGHQDLMHLRSSRDEKISPAGESFQRMGITEFTVTEPRPELSQEDEIIQLKYRIHRELIEVLDLKKLDFEGIATDPHKAAVLRGKTEKAISELLSKEEHGLVSSIEVRRKLINEITDEALGLGPLEDLIRDPEITDIMVNNKDEVYIERHGKLELTTKKFVSNEQVRAIIERIIAPLGRRIDESVPMVDARLADGSRVNAIIPPLSLRGPMLTIRKFARERLTVEDLLRINSISQHMADFIRACIMSRKNIIISGGTGSGKTTLLNILSSFIPSNERIITIEDAAELQLHQEHWGRLETRSSNIEGKGAVTTRDIFRNTLRMRPDRIIIGECRGAEVLDMLQAMNTGHDGSMTTVHANTTHDVITRLDSMILLAGVELPIRSIREMISSAVHILVHLSRLSDGTRKVVQITEIAGMLDETRIDLKDIFMFKQTGIDAKGNILGDYHATGYVPSFYEELQVRGFTFPREIFEVK